MSRLDEQANAIVENVDGAELVGKYKILSRFNKVTLDVDCLSTGCKTILNVLYFPDKVFCLKECMAVNPAILCLNYLDYQKDVKEIISQARNKLIVIDNADILLDDETRKYISQDNKNQYLIIGRNPGNLFATKENLFELVSRQVGEQTEFRIEAYL